MSKTTLGFIYTSLLYLLVGTVLGGLFFLFPGLRAYRYIHGHANLVGFVTFMIFGVAYHILPRFRGRPLYSEGLAWAQFWLAQVGLAGLLLFEALGSPLAKAFALVLALSFLLFIYNIGRTLLEPYRED